MKTLKTVTLLSTLTAAALTTLWGSPAQAQTSSQPGELQAIYACKSIITATERLACYDGAVGRFEAAEKSGEVVTISKSAIEKVERDAFGFNIPSLPSLGRIFGGSEKTDKSKTIKKENDLTAPVKEASRSETPSEPRPVPALKEKPEPSKVTDVTLDIRKTTEFGHKKTRFFMTNGQIWEQTDGVKVRVPKSRNGSVNTAYISKAAMGSFFLRVNGKGSAIRVQRVR